MNGADKAAIRLNRAVARIMLMLSGRYLGAKI